MNIILDDQIQWANHIIEKDVLTVSNNPDLVKNIKKIYLMKSFSRILNKMSITLWQIF
jgi:hypothetical protein